ncbi:hypothetical protein AV656_01565 [Bhargavaea cecembensis]|uniref:Uncharacterized protein n=1 Tax=Bhargavaea cecembensis TaxID=394098 RepID=A0A161SP53_9BACL|nr:hypothetical protein [Bhargavaea cecembensis]KZE39993.1 hypothetical protein AV656_01565 [Bhargavaea cecembensis]
MKRVRNEQGYTLVIVLLIVTLLLAFSATFMAGSLNHSRQERTVETGTQAVAAAEIGIDYESAHFSAQFKELLAVINVETRKELNELRACITPPVGEKCDTEQKRDAFEQEIEKTIRGIFFDELRGLKSRSGLTVQKEIDTDVMFRKTAVEVTPSLDTADPSIKKVTFKFPIEGQANGRTDELTAALTIQVPDYFLNPDEGSRVPVTTIEEIEDLTYEDVFNSSKPAESCTADYIGRILNQTEGNLVEAPYHCKIDGMSIENFVALLKDKGLDPSDFTVHSSDFLRDACGTGAAECKNLNNIDFSGINVYVPVMDDSKFNNMNNLKKATLIINGTLNPGNNIMNMGKDGNKQQIIVKGLKTGNNIKDMDNTNFLILGNTSQNPAPLEWGQHFEVSDYSKLCIDLDRLDPSGIQRLKKELVISDSASLIYYSESGKKLVMEERQPNKIDYNAYVQKADSYSGFLESCGVSIKELTTVEISEPNVIGSDYDIKVDY